MPHRNLTRHRVILTCLCFLLIYLPLFSDEQEQPGPEPTADDTAVPAPENMLKNGTFENGSMLWVPYIDPAAKARLYAKDGEMYCDVTDGGVQDWHVQLIQSWLRFEEGNRYTLSFDARSSVNRLISVSIGMDRDPFTAYGTKNAYLTTEMKHYSFTYFMSDPTEYKGRVSFNLGSNAPAEIVLDNIVLTRVDPPPTHQPIDIYIGINTTAALPVTTLPRLTIGAQTTVSATYQFPVGIGQLGLGILAGAILTRTTSQPLSNYQLISFPVGACVQYILNGNNNLSFYSQIDGGITMNLVRFYQVIPDVSVIMPYAQANIGVGYSSREFSIALTAGFMDVFFSNSQLLLFTTGIHISFTF
ncbi:MAG: carbohydrate binding domain-containing protein [Spirochaetales bacterium]|nr:carbohydrate binding domain-containing protein [Spirochaetales bacterium]